MENELLDFERHLSELERSADRVQRIAGQRNEMELAREYRKVRDRARLHRVRTAERLSVEYGSRERQTA